MINKLFYLTCIMIFVINPNYSFGEWNFISNYPEGRRDYIDYKKIEKKRCGFSLSFRCRKLWELQNLSKVGILGEKSRKVLVIYNCQTKEKISMKYKAFSDQMGKGSPFIEKKLTSSWKNAEENVAERKKFASICNDYFKKN